MRGEIDELIDDLSGITSLDTAEELDKLADVADRLAASPHSEGAIDALFSVFERFAEAEDYEVFWAVLHAIEKQGDYEAKLVQSVVRRPMEFNLLMVNRLLNSGVRSVEGSDLLSLLEGVAANSAYSESARERARRFVDFQRSRLL